MVEGGLISWNTFQKMALLTSGKDLKFSIYFDRRIGATSQWDGVVSERISGAPTLLFTRQCVTIYQERA